MTYAVWLSKTLQFSQFALRVRGKLNLCCHLENQTLGGHN
jgi:hypothetical protein